MKRSYLVAWHHSRDALGLICCQRLCKNARHLLVDTRAQAEVISVLLGEMDARDKREGKKEISEREKRKRYERKG